MHVVIDCQHTLTFTLTAICTLYMHVLGYVALLPPNDRALPACSCDPTGAPQPSSVLPDSTVIVVPTWDCWLVQGSVVCLTATGCADPCDLIAAAQVDPDEVRKLKRVDAAAISKQQKLTEMDVLAVVQNDSTYLQVGGQCCYSRFICSHPNS